MEIPVQPVPPSGGFFPISVRYYSARNNRFVDCLVWKIGRDMITQQPRIRNWRSLTDPMKQPEFLSKPIAEMTEAEWESLCDGCGLCCQIRVEDEDSGEIALSNVACRFLCLSDNRCSDYPNRKVNVPDCVKVTPENILSLDWRLSPCGFRSAAALMAPSDLRQAGQGSYARPVDAGLTDIGGRGGLGVARGLAL
jgi:hypothetical protein